MHVLSETKVVRHSKFYLYVTKYYNKSNSIITMVFKVITVQIIFRVTATITIQKIICGIEWDIW